MAASSVRRHNLASSMRRRDAAVVEARASLYVRCEFAPTTTGQKFSCLKHLRPFDLVDRDIAALVAVPGDIAASAHETGTVRDLREMRAVVPVVPGILDRGVDGDVYHEQPTCIEHLGNLLPLRGGDEDTP